jgi:hypothetical protein
LTGLVDSPKECSSFDFSWDALHHERRRMNEPRQPKPLTVQSSDNCYCVVPATSTTNEAVQSTSTSSGDVIKTSSGLSGQDASQTGGTWTGVTSSSPLVSAATSSRSWAATASPSSGRESVCIIKMGELNATPQGECYCFNGTRKKYQTGLCDVYS